MPKPRGGVTMPVIPATGAAATLTAQAGETAVTTVIFATEHFVYVRVPEVWRADELAPETWFEFNWPGENGVHVVPARGSRYERNDGAVVWELLPAGDYRFEQRREYIRVPVRAEMTIADLTSETAASQAATLTDVSETAMACNTRDLTWLELGPNTPVRVRFELADMPFASDGHVLRVAAIGTPTRPKGVRVVVAFERRAEFTNRLRRAVFEQHRRVIAAERERAAAREE